MAGNHGQPTCSQLQINTSDYNIECIYNVPIKIFTFYEQPSGI